MENVSYLNDFVSQYGDVFTTHVVPNLSAPDCFFLARVSQSMRKIIYPEYEKTKKFNEIYLVNSVSRLKWCISKGLKVTRDFFDIIIDEGHEEVIFFLRNNDDFPEIQHDFIEFMELCARGGVQKVMKHEFAINSDIVSALLIPKSSKNTNWEICNSPLYRRQFNILYQAASQGHVEILKWLCPLFLEEKKTEADICMISELCHEACYNWQIESATYLLPLGAKKYIYTCYIAARDHNICMVKWLIQNDFPTDQDLIDQICKNFMTEDPDYCIWIANKFKSNS
jgi:hypothetical protein